MSVVELGRLRSSAESIGILEAEWTALCLAGHPDALRFYLELRRSLAVEYAEHLPFHLPARQLAEQGFLPHRSDRKVYLRLIKELLGLGLIECVRKAGFGAEGRRMAATFVFVRPAPSGVDGVAFLAHYRRRPKHSGR